ncbi:uncharacterized protein LOC124146557 [Haliotis rufescens]|uniref:uncharacterized protein LOC124146557 n=1 Tax=Haliotis rufescens TaxID=6454 RepID=UPI00201F06FF|nr:uncharacterized protein LOC124146557 [Haliotis rufescens]
MCNPPSDTPIPHPTQCAQYYNCSAPDNYLYGRYTMTKKLFECPYPQLFNPDTDRCEHYSMVQCGNRTEPLWRCEYDRSKCFARGCGIPCQAFNPNCRNLPDGPNADRNKIGSPSYIVCLNQRLIYTGICQRNGFGPTFFDEVLLVCRYINDVNPICLTKRQPLIPHPTECAQYYNCTTPAMKHYWEANLQECPYPQLYDPGTETCEHYTTVQCGNRTEPLGKCEYLVGRDSGMACFANNPSCRNLPDGLNAYEHCPNSPKYIVCVSQRLVYTGVCNNKTGTSIFDAKLRACR